eukprot:11209124-Lingulodinium_polyedra.AAC.1
MSLSRHLHKPKPGCHLANRGAAAPLGQRGLGIESKWCTHQNRLMTNTLRTDHARFTRCQKARIDCR